MSTGRCAGCGHTGSGRKVKAHVLNCPGYHALFQQRPRDALDPEAEYVRFRAAEGSADARAEQRAQRLAERLDDNARQHVLHALRWATPADPLED
jgi:hypothetical protein